MVVDLPEPLGPSRPNTSPRRTSRLTSTTALTRGRIQKSLKVLLTPAHLITTFALLLLLRVTAAGVGLTLGVSVMRVLA